MPPPRYKRTAMALSNCHVQTLSAEDFAILMDERCFIPSHSPPRLLRASIAQKSDPCWHFLLRIALFIMSGGH